MSELRTPEVEDLLAVLSALDDKDTIFQLLEDLFTVREIRETSQRLAVARQLDAATRMLPSRRPRAHPQPPSHACQNA